MNAAGHPNWFKVAVTTSFDASHSITYGLILSGSCSATFKVAVLNYKMPHTLLHRAETDVAERILYFCLARNLIRSLGSTHIFTQSG